ncbi:MAG: methyl-accepting chemotaxis protein [Planctomycetota bacterium]
MKLKLTIGRKLGLGFGLVLILLTGVAAVGFFSNLSAANSLGEVAEMGADTAIGADTSVDMLMVRMNVKDFLINNLPKDLEEYQQYKDHLDELLVKSRESSQNPQRRAWLDEIEADAAAYDQAFREVTQIITRRNQLRAEVLDVVGKRAVDTLKQVNYAFFDANAFDLANKLTPVLYDTLEGRLYVMKFMRTSAKADYERVQYELSAALQKLDGVLPLVTDPDQLNTLRAVREDIQTYHKTFSEVLQLVLDRDEVVHNRLDVIGPRMVALQDQIKNSLSGDSEEATAEAQAQIRTAEYVILAATAVAVVLGIIAALLITRLIVKPIRHYLVQVAKVGEGDLAVRLDATQNDEIGDMGRGINDMVKTMSDVIANVQLTSHEVAGAATELAATSEQMSQSMEEQTSRINSVSTSMIEMDQSVQDVARKTADASSNADRSGKTAREGGEVVRDTVAGMGSIKNAVGESADAVQSLGKRGEQIGEIIAVINDIADQTNLLALNAAIEAARAGEHGRGFAVVADEVRKLADRTTQATDEISTSISAIQDETSQAVDRMNTGLTQVEAGVNYATQAGSSLEEIVSNTDEVASMIQSIAAATEQQSATSEQINNNLESTVAAIQQSAQATNQASSAVGQLSMKAEELQRLIGRFKLEKAA